MIRSSSHDEQAESLDVEEEDEEEQDEEESAEESCEEDPPHFPQTQPVASDWGPFPATLSTGRQYGEGLVAATDAKASSTSRAPNRSEASASGAL